VNHAVTSSLQTLHTDFYARMQSSVSRWGKCLNVNGDYTEVWSVLSAINILRINRSRIQFSAWQCSLLYFFDLEINPLKSSSASISMKVSWLSCMLFWWECHADDKWLWITGWIILKTETEAIGEKFVEVPLCPPQNRRLTWLKWISAIA